MSRKLVRSSTAKLPGVGASRPRGALQQHVVVIKEEVKEEASEHCLGVGNSRELLRSKIRARREAQGLEDIHVSFVEAVQHELTPEEEEKKERRREQNRRAARRCRMKKKLNANKAIEGFAQMIKENEDMAKEIVHLKKEKKVLEKVLNEHKRSGCCKVMTAGSPESVVPASPVSVEAPTAMDPESDLTELPEQFLMDTYLKDEGPITPGNTFEDLDLEQSQDISQLLNLPELCSMAESQVPPTTFHSSPSPHSADPRERLKNIMPASPHSNTHNMALLSPISPAATNQNRCSVSSTTSDWSAYSDHSHGFAVPNAMSPQSGFGRVNSFMTSTGGSISEMESVCSPAGGSMLNPGLYTPVSDDYEIEDEDDEVFGATSVDGNVFEQYTRRH